MKHLLKPLLAISCIPLLACAYAQNNTHGRAPESLSIPATPQAQDNIKPLSSQPMTPSNPQSTALLQELARFTGTTVTFVNNRITSPEPLVHLLYSTSVPFRILLPGLMYTQEFYPDRIQLELKPVNTANKQKNQPTPASTQFIIVRVFKG